MPYLVSGIFAVMPFPVLVAPGRVLFLPNPPALTDFQYRVLGITVPSVKYENVFGFSIDGGRNHYPIGQIRQRCRISIFKGSKSLPWGFPKSEHVGGFSKDGGTNRYPIGQIRQRCRIWAARPSYQRGKVPSNRPTLADFRGSTQIRKRLRIWPHIKQSAGNVDKSANVCQFIITLKK